jgi:hypothetical protein
VKEEEMETYQLLRHQFFKEIEEVPAAEPVN